MSIGEIIGDNIGDDNIGDSIELPAGPSAGNGPSKSNGSLSCPDAVFANGSFCGGKAATGGAGPKPQRSSIPVS